MAWWQLRLAAPAVCTQTGLSGVPRAPGLARAACFICSIEFELHLNPRRMVLLPPLYIQGNDHRKGGKQAPRSRSF